MFFYVLLRQHIREYLRRSRGLDGHLRTHHYINYVNPKLELVPMFTLKRPRYLGYRAGLLRKKSSRSNELAYRCDRTPTAPHPCPNTAQKSQKRRERVWMAARKLTKGESYMHTELKFTFLVLFSSYVFQVAPSTETRK